MSLGPTNITTNNTEILITDIGEDAPGGLPSLTCHTDLTECCRKGDTGDQAGRGEWYYPEGSDIHNMAAGENFFIRRNASQLIRLNRIEGTLSPTGSYCCVIPTLGGERTLCANIGRKQTKCHNIYVIDFFGHSFTVVVCESLPPLTDGTILYPDPTLGVGSVATYKCDTEFFLDGWSTRTCQNNGDWDGISPTCKGIYKLAKISLGKPTC